MTIGRFLSASLVLGSLAAPASAKQVHPASAKPAPTRSAAVARGGAIGGPVNKIAGINGATRRPQH